MPGFSLPFIFALGVLAGTGTAPVPIVVAQVEVKAESARRTDAALEQARALESALQAKQAAKREVERVHGEQLAEVERLSRRRASWNRDRQLRATRAEAHETGKKLARLDREIRVLSSRLEKQQKVLLGAIDRELDGEVADARRRTMLERNQRRLAERLRVRPRRIFVPDIQIDDLADPEELMEQAALIARAERQLLREERELEKRAFRYQRMARLQEKRQRDVELRDLEPADVRRVTGRIADPSSTGRGGGVDAFGEAEPGAPSDADSADPNTGFDDFSAVSFILADVIEPGTVDALEQASQSASAGTRAAAAERARKDVSDKLRRLRAQRAAIERRARDLKRR